LKNIDVFFSPVHSIADDVKQMPHIKRFIVLHDAIGINKSIPGKPAAIDDWFSNLVRNLDAGTYYFCVSENTRNDFLAASDKPDKDKMFVTHIAPAYHLAPDYNKDKLKTTLARYGIRYNTNNQYIFSMCSIAPRKNLVFTVSCFIKFIQKNNIDNMCFYLGGTSFDEFTKQFEEQYGAFQDYKDKIIRLGYVDDGDVNVLYSNSLFFTYLSQYEGFGMPPLEAMSAGTPVICSNNSSLPEVVGDAAITITYNDEESCIRAFEDLYFNADLREAYIKKGLERAKLFSWEKTVDKMTAVMLDALRGGAYVNP